MHGIRKTGSWALCLLVGVALAVGLFAGLVLWVARARSWGDCCAVSETEPSVQKTFNASGVSDLVVKNISGPIHVIGDGKGEIELTAAETMRGNRKDDIERGKREVRLNIAQEGNRIVACVERPSLFGFGKNGCKESSFNMRDSRYRVRFDFEVHVPAEINVILRTVNEGDIRVERLSGGFDLANVNGRVDLDAVSGAGEAKTINGEVKATFATNPGADCAFSTINGSVHLYFRPNLSAKLRYKTLNGMFTLISQ